MPQSFLTNMSVESRTKAFAERFSTCHYRMYVAEGERSGIVGFADFGEPRDNIDGYEAELYAIYLLPEFQGRGIGAGLFRRGVEDLVKRGVEYAVSARAGGESLQVILREGGRASDQEAAKRDRRGELQGGGLWLGKVRLSPAGQVRTNGRLSRPLRP